MPLLQVTATHDFRPDSLDPGITGIVFQGGFVATFDQAQFGLGKIASDVEIGGGGFGDDMPTVEVVLTPGGAGFSTGPWTVGEGLARVRLVGSASGEIMTGSSEAQHEFIGGGGADALTGGDETDTFVYAAPGDVEPGEKIDGGGLWEGEGYDGILVRGSNDFRGAEITDIEVIEITGDGTVATFFNTQLRVPGADFVDRDTMSIRAGDAGATVQTLIVHTDATGLPAPSDPDGYASLRYVSFWDWGEDDLIYIIGTADDDFLFGSVLADRISAATGEDDLVGRQGDDSLDGGDGRDTLDGGGDSDILTGGAGKDAFVFAAPLRKGKNLDHVTDFQDGFDKMRLEREDFVGLRKGKLSKDAFFSGDDASKAKDGGDRIIYNETTGALHFDKDGKGGAKAVQFAVLDGAPDLKAGDIVVFG